MPEITFQPANLKVNVKKDTNLLKAIQDVNIDIPSPCAGKGVCGKCAVRVISGDFAEHPAHKKAFSDEQLKAGWRLSCKVNVISDMEIYAEEAQQHKQVMLVDFKGHNVNPDQSFKVVPFNLTQPSINDQQADLERLLKTLPEGTRPVDIPQAYFHLPVLLRQNSFSGNAIIKDNLLITVLPPDKTIPLGLAVDIGTTTIAGSLFNLLTGEQLDSAGRANPQSKHGDDVISRIEFAIADKENIKILQQEVVVAINEIIAETCEQSGHIAEDICMVTIAGNTTMQHLFLGLDPEAISQSPFIPVTREAVLTYATLLELNTASACQVWNMPNISAYVGGDLTAGVLSMDLYNSKKTTLLVDIGTNGEMILRADGVTYACSTAAGPAFEGAGIEHGMRATTGAITRAFIKDNDIIIKTQGDAEIKGICGTGLVDLIACLLKLRIIDETGRMLSAEELEDEDIILPAELTGRLYDGEKGIEFLLSHNENKVISLTQEDVRKFQLAKGAIAAGIQVMIEHVGKTPDEVDNVILAGAFGNYLSPDSAKNVGLLPNSIDTDKVEVGGNTSLAGARLCLFSAEQRKIASQILHNSKHIELSGMPEFEMAFACSMEFPDYS